MKGLIQQWSARQKVKAEQRRIDARNAERRALCVEYAYNRERRTAILVRLAELSGEANISATAARIGFELDGWPQHDLIRHDPVRAQFDAEAA